MKFRLQILAFITFFNYSASVKAQFNTIKADTSRVVKGEISAPLPVRIDTVYIEKYVSPSQDEPIRRYSDPRDIQNLAFHRQSVVWSVAAAYECLSSVGYVADDQSVWLS